MPSVVTFVDRVKFYTLSNGVGPFQIGPAFPAYQGIEALIDAATYPYAVEYNSTFEVGTFVFDAASGTAIRSPQISSNGGAAVSFPANVLVNITPRAADLVQLGGTLPIIDALGNNTDKAISQNAATNAIDDLQAQITAISGTLQWCPWFGPTPGSNELLGLYTAPFPFQFHADFAGSAAAPPIVAPSADWLASIDRQVGGSGAWASIGSIFLPAAGGVTLATAGHVAINIGTGDRLRLVGPSVADATLAGFEASLLGKF